MKRNVFTYLLHSLLLATLTLGGGAAYAQNARLSEEPGQFMVDIKKLMESSKNPAYIKAAEELESIWMSQLNTTQQLQFVGQVRRLAAKGQKAGPVFALLMHNLYTVTTQQGDINGMMIMLDKASDKYDGRTLLRLLETTQLILEKKQLYASNFSKLYLTSGQYRFRFDDSRPDAGTLPTASDGWDTPADSSFSVPAKTQPMPTLSGALLDLQEATFAMVTAHDSVTFGPSTGSVSLREGTFVGKGGKFGWEAAGDPTIYALLDEYTFNIANPKLLAENVTLHYEEKLAKPVKGTLEFRSARRTAGKPATYPRFISLKNDAVLRNARKSMSYRGGLTLLGTAMYSTSLSNEPSTLEVSYKDRPTFRATSRRFALNDSVVTAQLATFSMPLGRDSIYHQGVIFRYSDDAGLLRLERADGTPYEGVAYQDSYHKMNIWAEAMRWSLPKDQVEFYMIAGKKEVPVRLESFDYFRPQRFQAMAEEFGFQPLLMATTYVQSEKKQAFTPDELATKLRQNPTILRRALEQLKLQGYFEYNEPTDQYRVTRKGVLYVLANFDKTDYDNFQIASQFQANNEVANATINLKDTLLTVRGVERFVVSDSLKIIAAPSDKQVVIGRNRSFTLNGQMKSANFRFAGRDLRFNYDQFFVNLNQVDSITFTPQDKYAKGLTGEVGGHVKYEKGGTFYLNDPKNKSGKQKGTKSPRLVVPDGMTVFFDQPVRGPLVYDQSVFFKIPKLDYDSLDRRDVAFVGTFNSGGMLPPIKTTLKSMEDNSLGFEYRPPGDVKVYDGKATVKFTEPLVMDNKGLRASGVLSHLSATLPTENMLFTSDSLLASGAEASIKEATIGKGYFPKVELKNYSLRWIPKTDSMLILSKGNSFNFYNGSSKLEGGLLLRSSGLYGYGQLKRADSELHSQDIKFNKEGFVANQSQFTISDGQQQSFRSVLLGRNVNVDFNVAKGQVELATNATGFGADSSSLEFPYAAYRTSISKARWDINKKSIAMKGDVKTSTFTSTAPEQEGLTFNGSAAVYEVEKMMLNISGVPYIRTADVKIIPDKGVVSVKKNGEMSAFKNARIEIDTLNSSHRLRNADIRITSRNRFEGSATYQYITARKDTFDIKMENFELREVGIPEATASRRTKGASNTQPAGTTYYTTARAEVREDDKLVLSPRMQFKGSVRLIAYESSLQLDGYIRPMLKPRPDLMSSWIVYKEAPGEILTIKIDKNLRNELEQPLFAGLHYRPSGGIYMSFLSSKEYSRDQDIFTAEGTLSFHEESKSFRILPAPGADGLVNEARAFTFNDEKGTASFAGPLKLVTADWLTASGTVDAQVDSMHFEFNTLLLMNLPALVPVLPELAAKIVQTNLDEQNSDAAEDDATRLNVKLASLIGQKAADDYQSKIAAGYKPLYEASSALDVPMVLSNVELRWSEVHGAYFSTGPIGVSNLGRHDINAQMEGMLEIRRSDRGDEFSLYLEASPDVWYYFDYSQKQLGVVSSMVDFNDQVLAKSKNVKSKDMELITLGYEEKAMFMDRFYDFYQPALKKAKMVKATEKKDTKKKPAKKAAETQEGF